MTHQTVQAAVDPCILRELPRFFGSNTAIVQEVIQNAVRAGAGAINITLNGDTLTFSDTGRGLDDPQLLLSVARSGWGAEVQGPAGMGVLSTLGKDFSRKVSFSSRSWYFELTFEEFASQSQIAVQTQSPQQGFTVSVQLAVVPRNIEQLISGARARAPLTVYYNGNEIKPFALDGPEFDLGWGRMILDSGADPRLAERICHSGVVFFEGFPIGLGVIDKLSDLAAAAAMGRKIIILPGAGSGIAPTLPDRTTIRKGPGLDAALDDISAAIECRVLADLRDVDLSVPVIRNLKQKAQATALARWCSSPDVVLETLLSRLGFVWSGEYTTSAAVDLDGDAGRDEMRGTKEFMVKKSAAVYARTGQSAALSLLRGRYPELPIGSSASGLDQELQHLMVITEHPVPESIGPAVYQTASLVRLVKRIVVGATEVPWFVDDNAVILAADADHALQMFGEWREEIGAALLAHLFDTHSHREFFHLWDSGPWTAGDTAQTVYGQLIKKFCPELERQRQEHSEWVAHENEVKLFQDLRQRLGRYGARLDSAEGVSSVLTDIAAQVAVTRPASALE